VTLANLASAYGAIGNVPEAIALYERVRDAQIGTLGPDHPDTLLILNNLGGAYIKAGKLSEAIALLERVRDAQIAKLGADHLHTLYTLSNLATAYWSAKQLDNSVALFEDVLRRHEAMLGRQHPSTQLTVASLGVNYKDAGRLDEAIPLLEKAYRASSKFPSICYIGAQLLDAYVRAGHSAAAAKLAPDTVVDARKIWPKESPQLASALMQLALTLLQLKDYGQAESLLRECLATREKTQPDHWNTFNSKSLLGGALLAQRKYADAEPMLVSGFDGMKQRELKIPPEGKDRLTKALERLVQLYEATGRQEEVAKWRKQLEARKAAQSPKDAGRP
jgi:eukaryotic-like serine/threonine-protein kinase